ADVEVAGGRVDQADVVLGVAGRVVRGEAAAGAQVDLAGLAHRADPAGVGGAHLAEEHVQLVAPDHPGRAHQPGGVGEVPGAALVHHDLGPGEHPGDVADAAGVVEVDVGDDDGGQVGGADAEGGQAVPEHLGRAGGADLHHAGPLGADQVAGGDARVAGHPGVDGEHLVAQCGDALLGGAARVHGTESSPPGRG